MMSVDYLRHEIEASLKRSEQLLLLDRMRRHMYVDDQQEKESGKSKFGGTFNTVRLKKYFGLGGSKKKEKAPLYKEFGYYGGYPNAQRQLEVLGNIPRHSYHEPVMPAPHYPEAWMYTTVTSKTVHTVYTSMRMAPGGVYRARPSVYGWDGYVPLPTRPPVTFEEPPLGDESGKSACICRDTGTAHPPMTWSRKQRSSQCTCDVHDACNGMRKVTIANEEKKDLEDSSRKENKKKFKKKNLLTGNFRTVSGGSTSVPQRKSILECNITAYDLISKNNAAQKKGKQKVAPSEPDPDDTLAGNVLESDDIGEKKGVHSNKTSKPTTKTVEEEWDDYTDPMEVRICGQKIRVGETYKNGSYDVNSHPSSPSPRIRDTSVRMPLKENETIGQSSLAKATNDQMNYINQSTSRSRSDSHWRSQDRPSSRPISIFSDANSFANRSSTLHNDSNANSNKYCSVYSDSNITSVKSSELKNEPKVQSVKEYHRHRPNLNAINQQGNKSKVEVPSANKPLPGMPQNNHMNSILRNGSAVIIKINDSYGSNDSHNNNNQTFNKESKNVSNVPNEESRCPSIPRILPSRPEPVKSKIMNGKSTVMISRDVLYEEEEVKNVQVNKWSDKDKTFSLSHSQSTPNITVALQQPHEKNTTPVVSSTEFNVKPILKKPSSLDTSSETDSDLYASEWNDSKRKKKRVHFKSSSESNLLELSEVIASEPNESADENETGSVDRNPVKDTPLNEDHGKSRATNWKTELINDRDDDDYLTPRPKSGPNEPIYVNQAVFDLPKDNEYDDCVAVKELSTHKPQELNGYHRIEVSKHSSPASDSCHPVNLRRSHSARELSPVASDNEGRTRSPPSRSNSFQGPRTQGHSRHSSDGSSSCTPDRGDDFSAERSDSEATIVAGEEVRDAVHEEASRHLDWLLREKGSGNILPKSIKDSLQSEETLYDDTAVIEEENSSGFGSRTSSMMGESHSHAFLTVRDSLRRKNGFRASGGPHWSPKAGRSAPDLHTGSVDRHPRKKTGEQRPPLRNHSWDRSTRRPQGTAAAGRQNPAIIDDLSAWEDPKVEGDLGKENRPEKNVSDSETGSPSPGSSPSSECNYKSNFEFIINLRNKKFSIPRPPLVKPKSSPIQRHNYVAPPVAKKTLEPAVDNSEEETMTVSIYEQISEPIYEELPDYPETQTALALVPPPLPTGPLGGGGQPRRSIFEGASRNEILSILEDAKERGVENMEVVPMVPSDMEDRTEDIDPQVLPAQRNHRIRVSNISNLSDSSHSSDDSNNTEESKDSKERRSSAEVERNDSGVGPETSKPIRLRRQTSLGQNNDESLCEDCEQPLENKTSGMLFEPLVCKKCSKKRAERRETIAEIAETEFKYGRDLKIIRDEFSRPMAVAGLLTQEQLTSIFLNIDELIEINTKFTEKLKDALDIAVEQGDDDYMTVNIGKLFLESTEMLHSFETYCVRQGAACMLLTNLEKDKELLRIFLRVSQMENTLLRRMNLNSFLMVPVQRVTKYPLLLNRLYKVTPYHHKDREAIRDAQQKIEFHLEHINQQAKDISGTKVWRRISHISSTYNKRVPTEQDIGNIKLRKMALEVLEWNSDEVRFVMEGRLQFAQLTDHIWNRKNKTFKLSPVYALLVTLGKPNANYRPDLVESESLMFPKNTGIREASLLFAKEKTGRFSFVRDPLHLQRCVICSDPESDDMFEIQDFVNKEGYIFKAEDTKGTQEWLKQLRYHAKDLGSWRRRRNALANIMINGMVRP